MRELRWMSVVMMVVPLAMAVVGACSNDDEPGLVAGAGGSSDAGPDGSKSEAGGADAGDEASDDASKSEAGPDLDGGDTTDATADAGEASTRRDGGADATTEASDGASPEATSIDSATEAALLDATVGDADAMIAIATDAALALDAVGQ